MTRRNGIDLDSSQSLGKSALCSPVIPCICKTDHANHQGERKNSVAPFDSLSNH